MNQTSTIHSVDTGLIYAVLKLSFPSNTEYSVFILYVRASQTMGRDPKWGHEMTF